MCRKVFVAGTGQHCGKTTMSMALMHLAKRHYRRVGFMKPVGPKTEHYQNIDVDKDALLIARLFRLEHDLSLMSPVAFYKHFTREFLAGRIDPEGLRRKIVDSYRQLEQKYDFMVIEGAGHGGVGSVIGLNNAQTAKLLDAPVCMVTEGGIGSAIDAVLLNRALFLQEQSDINVILVNKLQQRKRDEALSILSSAFAGSDIKVTGGLSYSPILANPTLAHISQLLGFPLYGDMVARSRIILDIQLGAASSQKVVDGLNQATLLIVTSSRDELIVTLSSLYHIPEYREKIVGIIIAGFVPVSPISQQILDDSDIPYIRVNRTTADVFSTIKEDVAKITAEDKEKIDWISANADKEIDMSIIESALC